MATNRIVRIGVKANLNKQTALSFPYLTKSSGAKKSLSPLSYPPPAVAEDFQWVSQIVQVSKERQAALSQVSQQSQFSSSHMSHNCREREGEGAAPLPRGSDALLTAGSAGCLASRSALSSAQ